MTPRSLQKRLSKWTLPALLAGLLVSTAGGALASPVQLDVDPSHPMLLAGSDQRTYLRVAVTGQPDGDADSRAPLNVALVLDRSGSMQGTKIEEAKRAAIMAIDRLRPDDIVSVVAYQSTVAVLVPATRVGDGNAIRDAIRRISAGGNTALFAGVSKGAGELRKFFDENHVNSIILLSDGLANVGPSSPGDLAELGLSLAREGMTVTTIGLGLDYNEDLMTTLAFKSEGNHFFVEDAADLKLAYATEFGDALSVVAQGVVIWITCNPGVRPVRVLGREADISGQVVRTTLNQIYGDQTKYVLLEVELPAGSEGQVLGVADVQLRYRNMRTGSWSKVNRSGKVTFTASASTVEKMTNEDVMVEVVRQVGAERNELAVALRDAGKVEEARQAFRANWSYLSTNAAKYDDDELQQDAQTQDAASKNLDDESWTRSRKQQLEWQLKTQKQRAKIDEQDKKKGSD